MNMIELGFIKKARTGVLGVIGKIAGDQIKDRVKPGCTRFKKWQTALCFAVRLSL
jgi:hypothetical protein